MSITTNRDFRVGEVIGQGFSVLLRNIISFSVITILIMIVAIVLAIAITVVSGLSAFFSATFEGGGPDQTAGLQFGVGFVIAIILIVLEWLALQQLGVAAITFGAIQDLRGRKAGIGECLTRGLALMFPTLGVALLTALLCAVGAVGGALVAIAVPLLGVIAAIVLVIIIYMVLWVAVPVAVVERPGVVASLERSRSLTQGSRLRIFGIVLLVLVIGMVVSVASKLIFSQLNDILSSIVGFVLQVLFTSYFACVTAVGYYRLRVSKEGIDIEDVAKIFD